MIETRSAAARLFTVGIGSASDSSFMRRAAELGRGTFVVISALHEVGEKMDRLFDKLGHPQVTNIDVELAGRCGHRSYPESCPTCIGGP